MINSEYCLTMLARRLFIFGVVSLMLALAGQSRLSYAENSDTAEKAEAFISSLADQAIKALTVPDISQDEREKRFRVMLNDNFAVSTIGRWVLGRYWKRATEAQRAEYLALFENLLVVTYVDRFSKYTGENLKVVKSMLHNPKDALVFSELVHEGTQSIQVDWRVHTKDSVTFKIVDVMVEGMSMGQTQRSEFASVIRQNGGKLEGLLSILRKRVS